MMPIQLLPAKMVKNVCNVLTRSTSLSKKWLIKPAFIFTSSLTLLLILIGISFEEKGIGETIKIILSSSVIGAFIAVIGVWYTIDANRKLQEKARQQAKETEETIRKQQIDVVTTAIRSDIRSIVYALKEINLIKDFIKTYESTYESDNSGSHLSPWVDAPRAEDYFQLFGAVAPQIGKLNIDLARGVVKFYTFMRVARDAAAPLGNLENDQSNICKQHIKNALVSLRSCLEAAKQVLSSSNSPTGINDDGVKIAQDLIELIDKALPIEKES